jgi:hypothetical protein
MKYFFLPALLVSVINSFAQQPPGTEIFVFDITTKKSCVVLANPQNITNRPGYDNQPFFHPDKTLIYYTSADTSGRTDLVEYDFKLKTSRNFTKTPEREYSPTVTPDKKFISCIIQRDNGAQDLGKYPIDGGEPTVLINTLTVGYHAWITQQSLLLFVLGDTFTIRQYDLSSSKDVIVAKNIGRSLHKIPKSEAMSFVHKISDKEWIIKKINPNRSIESIVATLPGREDLTWTPDGKIIMSDGKKLFYYQPGKTTEWRQIEMPLQPAGVITRLAVNKTGTKLTMVISE